MWGLTRLGVSAIVRSDGIRGDLGEDDILRPTVYAGAAGSSPGDGSHVPTPEPQRVGSHPVRASGLDDAQGHLQSPVLSEVGRSAGGARHHLPTSHASEMRVGARCHPVPGAGRAHRHQSGCARPHLAAPGDHCRGPSALEKLCGEPSLPWLQAPHRRASILLRCSRGAATEARLRVVFSRRGMGAGSERYMDWLGQPAQRATAAARAVPEPVSHLPLGERGESGQQDSIPGHQAGWRRLGAPPWVSTGVGRNVRRYAHVFGGQLSSGELALPG